MPRLFVVSDQGDVAALARTLLGARVGAARRDAAIAALRDANPGLQLDALRPGQVVVVPDGLATRDRADVSAQDGLSGLLAQAAVSVKELVAAADRAEEQRRAEADEVRAVLSSPEVHQLAGQIPELKRNLSSVDKTLSEQDVRAEKTRELLSRSAEEWLADLDGLGGIGGG